MKKKYVLVGAGGRALYMFATPLFTELKDHTEFLGIYDSNPIRADIVSKQCGDVPIYKDFHEMLRSVKPDVVIVATSDSTHHYYIIESLMAGCDVISEKPMTIDRDKCSAILEAEKKSGKKVSVTFNMRYVPYIARVKELLLQNIIGDVHHVNLEWNLDRKHGADYFRRWHGQLELSGGLLVHKSTHHFDLINWWLDSYPREVFANGALKFYGPTREKRGQRCLTCEYKKSCEFYMDINKDEFLNQFYYQAEAEDGYIRDQCVFGERINIYDTMSVSAKYVNGTTMSYSLNAYSPNEGWRATITGSNGRMELEEFFSGPRSSEPANTIRVFTPNGETVTYDIVKSEGGHGGGDERLRRMLFVGDLPDPLGQLAGSLSGAMSLLIGDAANRSIMENKSVVIPS